MSTEPPATDRQKAAYQAGQDAFRSGADSATCPHPKGDPEGLRIVWIRGFVKARREAGVREPNPLRTFAPAGG